MNWIGFAIAGIAIVITLWTWRRFRGAMDLLEMEQRSHMKALTTEHDARIGRLKRESEGRQEEKAIALVKDLATTYDAIREALALEPDDPGLIAIRDSFLVNLKRHDVLPIQPSVGDAFIPSKHEAIESRASEVEKGHVVQLFRDGWTIHDRCVRPALVAVSSGQAPDEEE